MNVCGTGATTKRRSALLILMMSLAAVGCGGGGGGGETVARNDPPDQSGASPTPDQSGGPQTQPADDQPTSPAEPPANSPVPPTIPGQTNRAPTISGTPALNATVGVPYTFTPTAQDPDGDVLAFSIENRPPWAEFNTVTGELRGTPSASHLGSYANVRISVSDGKATASLPAFTLTVTPATSNTPAPPSGDGRTLSWALPPEGFDGATLNQLAGFRIHYGHDRNVLHEVIEVRNPGVLSYTIDSLPPGTYYFAVRAFLTTGEQSELSNVVAVEIS